MAFKYFAEQKVDIAVVEVGLGGRLDCTNIINPLISVITNISLDHTKFLGNTLRQIAREKAGIIKESIPVVIGETVAETREVFLSEAEAMHAPIHLPRRNTQPSLPEVCPKAVGYTIYIIRNSGRNLAEITKSETCVPSSRP